jgi:cyclase
VARLIGGIFGALVVLVAIGGLYVYDLVTSLDATPVTDDVWMLDGAGGNVGVLRTGKGAVVVDTMTFRLQGERIRERAAALAGGPVQAVINTHYHTDHTHGNPGLVSGTRVVSTQRTLDYLMYFDAPYWEGDAAQTLPNDLFDTAHEMRIGGKTIRSIHPGRGHTGGDLVVLFVEDRVLHTGDLLFNMRYPNIDLEAGGSVAEWIGTLDRVLELDFDRVIPGHGPVTDAAGIRAFQAFLKELWGLGVEAARAGRTLDETLEMANLTTDEGFGVIGVPFVFRLDRDFVVKRAWQEATGAAKPLDVPRASGAREEQAGG